MFTSHNLRRSHRLFAGVLGLFLLLHLAHHLTLIAGKDAHIATGEILRVIYRSPLITVLISLAVVVQIVIGLVLTRRRWTLRRGWPLAQTISGLYLVFFMLQHVGAVLLARYDGIDTNVHFAAAGLYSGAWALYFAPYYTLAVTALFVHVAVYLRRRGYRRAALPVAYSGVALGLLYVAGLAGLFGGPTPPASYLKWIAAHLPF